MSMTRTDFKAIADVIRTYKLRHQYDDYLGLVLDLCPYFKKANPTFDKGKFLRDCGYYQEG